MRCSVSPGQEVKWPRLIARTRVETTGLKSVPWRKEARSALMDLERMALEAMDGVDVGALVTMEGREDLGAKGMVQRPLLLRGPLIITFPFFIILTSYLLNNTIQSTSHNLLMEISEFVEKPLRTCPVAAEEER